VCVLYLRVKGLSERVAAGSEAALDQFPPRERRARRSSSKLVIEGNDASKKIMGYIGGSSEVKQKRGVTWHRNYSSRLRLLYTRLSPRFSQLISDEVDAIASCGCVLTPDGMFRGGGPVLGERGVPKYMLGL
jgi:hypothetical protein